MENREGKKSQKLQQKKYKLSISEHKYFSSDKQNAAKSETSFVFNYIQTRGKGKGKCKMRTQHTPTPQNNELR